MKNKRREDRKKKRIIIKMNEKPAVLLDISPKGIKLSAAAIPSKRNVNIIIEFEDKKFNLKGYVRWVKRKVSFHSPKDIGLSIEKAPEEFYKFLDSI